MKTTRQLIRFFTIACLLGSGWAQAITTPGDIEKAVYRHVNELLKQHRLSNTNNQRIDFSITKIDPNLRMASCSSPLQLQKNEDRLLGRISIKVHCNGPKPWKIYVPVTIKAYQNVVTAAAPLAQNQPLESALLNLTEKEVSQLTQGFFSSIDEVVGKTLKRPLQTNGVIQPNMVVESQVIHRGDEVMIMAASGALSVKSPGIAISNGRIGEQIQVKNKASKRVVMARVINGKLVQVVM